MDKKIFSLFGMAGLACIACCAGPLLAVFGISSTSLGASFGGPVSFIIAGSLGVFAVLIFIFRKQTSKTCNSNVTCEIDCGCKTKT